MVYFGIVEEPQRLRAWVLAESSGRMDQWILKYKDDLLPLARHLNKHGGPKDAPWMVHDVSDAEEDVPAIKLFQKRHLSGTLTMMIFLQLNVELRTTTSILTFLDSILTRKFSI